MVTERTLPRVLPTLPEAPESTPVERRRRNKHRAFPSPRSPRSPGRPAGKPERGARSQAAGRGRPLPRTGPEARQPPRLFLTRGGERVAGPCVSLVVAHLALGHTTQGRPVRTAGLMGTASLSCLFVSRLVPGLPATNDINPDTKGPADYGGCGSVIARALGPPCCRGVGWGCLALLLRQVPCWPWRRDKRTPPDGQGARGCKGGYLTEPRGSSSVQGRT